MERSVIGRPGAAGGSERNDNAVSGSGGQRPLKNSLLAARVADLAFSANESEAARVFTESGKRLRDDVVDA